MNRPTLARCLTLTSLAALLTGPVHADARTDAKDPPERGVVDEIRAQAEELRPLMTTAAARSFLDATAHLPQAEPRTIYRDRAANAAFSESEAANLSADRRAGLEKKTYDATFYYYTGYGTPLLYGRALDLAARAGGRDTFSGKRVFDFGYGAVGHLRLLAITGADAVGTEIHPVLRALYSAPRDQGPIRGPGGPEGRVTLHHGRWPGEGNLRKEVGGGFDLWISKNVLKRGYIHPARKADPNQLIDLGVSDEQFVRAVYDAMAPRGIVMIYNFSPAQAPPDKPFIPWADGRCPFDRAMLERVGFEVLAYDKEDHEAAHDVWFALDLAAGQTREALAKDLFAHYTLLRKP